jgi:hypothetical protein
MPILRHGVVESKLLGQGGCPSDFRAGRFGQGRGGGRQERAPPGVGNSWTSWGRPGGSAGWSRCGGRGSSHPGSRGSSHLGSWWWWDGRGRQEHGRGERATRRCGRVGGGCGLACETALLGLFAHREAPLGGQLGPGFVPAVRAGHAPERQQRVDLGGCPVHTRPFASGLHHQLVRALHRP